MNTCPLKLIQCPNSTSVKARQSAYLLTFAPLQNYLRYSMQSNKANKQEHIAGLCVVHLYNNISGDNAVIYNERKIFFSSNNELRMTNNNFPKM
jgi:hypothetical protein